MEESAQAIINSIKQCLKCSNYDCEQSGKGIFYKLYNDEHIYYGICDCNSRGPSGVSGEPGELK